jgi:hypothetical protein
MQEAIPQTSPHDENRRIGRSLAAVDTSGNISGRSELGRPYKTHEQSDIALKIAQQTFGSKNNTPVKGKQSVVETNKPLPSFPGRSTHSAAEVEKVPASPSEQSIYVKASGSVHQDAIRQRYVSASKPLPPVPKLEPTPRNRSRSREQPQPGRFVTLEDIRATEKARKEKTSRDKAVPHSSWMRRIASELKVYEPDVVDRRRKQRHLTHRQNNLKAKISSPRPLLATNARTVNIAVESGGVGGPAAARSLPVKKYAYPKSPTEHRRHEAQRSREDPAEKYKLKPTRSLRDAPGWHPDHVTQISDLINVANQPSTTDVTRTEHPQRRGGDPTARAGPSRAYHPRADAPRTVRSDARDTDGPESRYHQRPSTRHGNLSGSSYNRRDEARIDTEARDTRFYQPYHDVLQAYQG